MKDKINTYVPAKIWLCLSYDWQLLRKSRLLKVTTLKSLIIVQHILLIFGIFTYLHGLLRDCTFIYFGKKILPTWLLETNIFTFFLQFSVLKPYLYKNMYFSSFEFMNLSTGLLLQVYLAFESAKWRAILPTFLEKILPTRLLDPTHLLISEKSSHLHCY